MKVLMICNTFPADQSEQPLAPAHSNVARALQSMGHTVEVISFCSPLDKYAVEGSFDNGGIRVHLIYPDFERASRWGYGLKLPYYTQITAEAHLLWHKSKDVIREFAPDIIDCQEFNALGFFIASEHPCPLVIHCHGPLAHLLKSGDIGYVNPPDVRLVEQSELFPIAEADEVIACSLDVAKRLSIKSGRPLTDFNVIKVPFMCPPALSNCEKEPEDSFFPKLFYFGRIERQKGVDLLLQALELIAQEFPNFKLTMGGSESIEQATKKKYADVMRESLTEMGLRQNVDFVGFLNHDQIQRFVANSDICVFPSRYETAGYACIEAVAYGGAVVAAAAGGLPEYHEHGVSAWLVKPNSAFDLAEGIKHLTRSKDLRQLLKKSGRAHIEQVCDPAAIAEQTTLIYEKAIKTFATRPRSTGSLRILGALVSVLPDQADVLAYHPTPDTKRIDSPIDAVALVKNIGEMVLGHLSRVWKEGYDAGFEDAIKQNKERAASGISVRSILRGTARGLKRKLGQLNTPK